LTPLSLSHPESNIEKIVVVAEPEVANFEIYSEKHSAQAIEKMMNIVALNLRNDDERDVNVSEKI